MNIGRTSTAVAAVAGAALLLTACGSSSDAADGGGPTVVASFYPLAFAAERVGGENVDVQNLTQPGAESHDLELTGQQVGQVADADLVVYLHGFQPSVDAAVEQNAQDEALDVGTLVDFADHGDGGHEDESHAEHEGETHEDESHAEHEGETHEGESHEGHDHENLEGDPHIWLDPTIMVTITESVADQLAETDPDNAQTYRSNADALTEQLRTLDQDFTTGLADCKQDMIVVAHEAFGYLADRYGLRQVGIGGLDPEAEPSPERLAEVHDVVRAEGVTTIFYERLVSPDVAETLADDLGVEAAVLDPIEGRTDDTADQDYLELMRANLEALRTANQCA
ncbi:zinc transport system substrate-binding protein [Haloactinopolyspora alba]|uniref:Zinc transport system substrate-binding protein n=1 Tax=Haloactinopolyspora alba TaxID=648780 RepID=A0A2P8EBW1_9ACTN|nr:metal ABC transporter substrate-binding protein [Haloactinopolyspora alba]PSL06952.1 zinc transport system substrate-binding protein [Haloactinopolyspora alba]